MGEVTTTYNVLVLLAVTFGSFSYGYCASILANTYSKVNFYKYMQLQLGAPHTNSLIAAWSALLYVGGFLGCCLYPSLSSKYGRRLPLAVGAGFVIVGGALQAGEVDTAMLCVARILTGIGVGNFLPGCPLYQAEVAPAHHRGFAVGLHAGFVGAGFAVAQWVGVGFFYVPGQTGWRVPLAMQCVGPIALLCILPFLPESPRWLYLNGRAEDAKQTLIRLHRNKSDASDSYIHNEYHHMSSQLDLEVEQEESLWKAFKDPHIRKRFVVGMLATTASQCSGSIVILTYSSVIYAKLGFDDLTIEILTGVWTSLLTIFNLLGGVISDKTGRVKLFVIGLCGCLLSLVMSAILTALYGDTTDKAGNSAATFFIFLFVCFFATAVECPSFVYTSEIFPARWRPLGVAFSLSFVQWESAILTGAAAIAFQNIGWRFYLVFASFTAVMIVVVYFVFPETKGYTLEQISKAFGDVVVDDLAEGTESKGGIELKNFTSGGSEVKRVLETV